jgi:hypothetical protein
MAKTMLAPAGATEVSHAGERYTVKNGKVTVPDGVAELLKGSHGFVYEGEPILTKDAATPVHAKVGASDDDAIIDDSASTKPTAAEFSATMSQTEMKMFLREHGVTVPRTGTVRDLRRLVEETYNFVEKEDAQESAFKDPNEGKVLEQEAKAETTAPKASGSTFA